MAYTVKEKLDAVNALLNIENEGERMSSILKKNGFSDEQITTIRKKYMDEFLNSLFTEFSQLVCDVAYDVLLSEEN